MHSELECGVVWCGVVWCDGAGGSVGPRCEGEGEGRVPWLD